MTYALALALILIALHLGNRISKLREVEQLRRHAAREGIRQGMHLDRWSTGEMPLTDQPVGKSLRLLKKAEVVVFRKERIG